MGLRFGMILLGNRKGALYGLDQCFRLNGFTQDPAYTDSE